MSTTEKFSFQAETRQLLDIVIHSLYTDQEIFVRELISNAADACERFRFIQVSGRPLYQPEIAATISIATNDQEDTITITDTGIGMTHDELVENLGKIAHSGTKQFLKSLTSAEGGKPDLTLIGQFGVGFYSAFMAAKKVKVFTRSFLPDSTGWGWTSEGMEGYEMEPAPDTPRGTKIILYLKDGLKKFAKAYEIERIIKKYSNFVQFPIELDGKHQNTVQAIWARNKSEIKEEEYNEFYTYLWHSQEKPLFRQHFTADAPLSIQALLYVPAHNFETSAAKRTPSEVNLYCRKVLIESRVKGIFPDWLRFVKGVVDSEDFPLNISRETIQDSSLMQKLSKVLTGRFIKFLEEQTEKDPEAYLRFYDEYNRFLKEGILTEFAHVNALGKLLRFESSAQEAGKTTSLADYVKRMQPEQKEIFYLLAPNREAAESSPYFEVFNARKLEVLFLYEPLDEIVMENLISFDSKDLISAEKAELQLGEIKEHPETISDEKAQELAKWLKSSLGEKIEEVRVSKRLLESPAALFDTVQFMTSNRRRLLKSMKGGDTPLKFNLEINTRHCLISRLEHIRHVDSELAGKVAEQVLDNAKISAGLLDDPRVMLKRLNELIERAIDTTGPKTG